MFPEVEEHWNQREIYKTLPLKRGKIISTLRRSHVNYLISSRIFPNHYNAKTGWWAETYFAIASVKTVTEEHPNWN